jgi:hypothetical protein
MEISFSARNSNYRKERRLTDLGTEGFDLEGKLKIGRAPRKISR